MRKGPCEGLQHGNAAGGLGREELQGLVAELQGLEDLAGADDAGQQRVADLGGGLGQLRREPRGHGELGTGIGGTCKIGGFDQGTGPDDGLGHRDPHRLDHLQGHARPQGDLQDLESPGVQGLRQGRRVLQLVDGQHRDHRCQLQNITNLHYSTL